jgi:hypothetical protein
MILRRWWSRRAEVVEKIIFGQGRVRVLARGQVSSELERMESKYMLYFYIYNYLVAA